MNRFLPLIVLALALALPGCGGGSNPGVIFDPTPPGGSGGGGGGSTPSTGPSGAPTPGSFSANGAPSVTAVEPTGGGISTETPICVTFSESVQVNTVSSTTLLVRVQGGTTVPASIASFGGGRFVVLTPATALPTNRTIEVVATTTIHDLSGVPLNVPVGGVIGSFTTEATTGTTTSPRVVGTFPRAGATNVSPGTPTIGSIPPTPTQVVVVFSEPIAPSTILGDLTPPPAIEKIGFTLIEVGDPDGAGPLGSTTTPLIPGVGAILLPQSENRVWVATPTAPFFAGATVTIGVGPGTKNDDLTPQGVNPVFTASFTIALFGPPSFVNVDTTPANEADAIATTPTALNNLPTLPTTDPNPNYAGKFALGVVFAAGSLDTDTLELQLHDATSGGSVTFSKKARLGAGQRTYTNLSVLKTTGESLLAQGAVVLAARVKRGTAFSAWSLGPPIVLDTLVPAINTVGPPAEGATLFAPTRVASIYGTASESPLSAVFTSIQSPTGVAIPVPIPASASGHLLRTSGSFFQMMPLIPAPAITAGSAGTPPNEPKAKGTILLSDAAFNTSTPLDVTLVHRGRLGGPALATQDAITVVVFDEDDLKVVPTAIVLLDAAVPSGNATSQVRRAVAPGGAGEITAARFTAGPDFAAATPAVTITASATGYDITTVVAVPTSFLSIPIRKTRSIAGNTDPALVTSLSSATASSTVDVAMSARGDLGDPMLVTSTVGFGGVPIVPTTAVAAFRPLFVAAYMRAATSFAFTYVNEAFGFPVAPIALGGTSSTTVTFGQSYSQTTDTADDPVAVPPAGSITVFFPGAPFDSDSLVGGVESAIVIPGSRVGLTGQIGAGIGRADAVAAGMTTIAVNFDPKVNAFLFAVDGAMSPPNGTIVPAPIDPNVEPTEARVSVRAQDTAGNVARALFRTVTTLGPIGALTLPSIPQTLAPTSSSGGIHTPKVRWADTLSSVGTNGLFVVNLKMKGVSPARAWHVFVRRTDCDLSVGGEAAIQLPSPNAFLTDVGSPIPSSGALFDQAVDAFIHPGLSFLDFFFDDLRVGPSAASESAVGFARGQALEIIY